MGDVGRSLEMLGLGVDAGAGGGYVPLASTRTVRQLIVRHYRMNDDQYENEQSESRGAWHPLSSLLTYLCGRCLASSLRLMLTTVDQCKHALILISWLDSIVRIMAQAV